MKNRSYLLFLFVFSFSVICQAQVDSVIVEKYYISNANDNLDTTANDSSLGNLAAGSFTYRIYIDLCDSCRLKKIFGNANHTLMFKSDSLFFNHKVEGKSFGNSIKSNRFYDNPTVALDTWLTLDHAASNRSGVLKTEDTNTVSMLGGDTSGGFFHPGGFLHNNDTWAGVPLSTADGLFKVSAISLTSGGDLDFVFQPDNTIFGSLVPDSQFVSNDAFLQTSPGLKGPGISGNKILVAQLTTRGQIKFELNIVVEVTDSLNNKTDYILVAKNPQAGEILSPYLTYPPVCGCTDKKYLEYNPMAPCLDSASCKTLKVFGCTDPLACNFDSAANILLSGFCCYPGSCQDRDLSLACPNLSERYSIYPNPAQGMIAIEIYSPGNHDTKYEVYDIFGRVALKKNTGIISGTATEYADISRLQNGVYMMRIFVGETFYSKTFIKN